MKWIVLLIFIGSLGLILVGVSILTASPAEGQSIRVHCDIYATNRVDPIVVGSEHLHRQFGNLSTDDLSTFESLYANKETSCDGIWWTNAGWFPVERYEPVTSISVYYNAPGDPSEVHDIPNGLQMVSHKLTYTCGAKADDPQPKQNTPPYGCTSNWATQIEFPNCWDGFRLSEEGTIHGPTRTSCPDTHPVRIVEAGYQISHRKGDGLVANPLTVSAGVNQWEPFSSMHADYFFAAQDEFQQAVDLDVDGTIEHTDGGYSELPLVDLCLLDAPAELKYNNPRCRTSGLTPAQATALENYYQ
jgi:hypothetical protein